LDEAVQQSVKGRAVAYVGALVLVLMVGAFTPPAFAYARPPQPGEVSPSQILWSVPVTLINDKSAAAPNPFQQMVVIDSSKYSAYEAPNLQNVIWYYPNGTIIPAWIESGASSSSHATVWWLRLRGFPAHSSLTIYMGFAAPNASFLSTEGPTGTAPQLSPTYGEYDDGFQVFDFYDNFAGTSLKSWWTVHGANYSVDNGLSSTGTPSAPSGEYIVANYNVFPGVAIEFYGLFSGYNNVGTGTNNFQGTFFQIGGAGGYQAYGIEQWNGTSISTSIQPRVKIPTLFTIAIVNSTTSYYYISNSQYANYSLGSVTMSAPGNYPYPLSALATNGPANFSAYHMYYIFVRSLPPNNAMPRYIIWPVGPGAFAYVSLLPVLDYLAWAYYRYFLTNLLSITVAAVTLAVFSPALTRSRVGAALRRNWGVPLLMESTGLLLAGAAAGSLGTTSLADSLSVFAYLALVTALLIVALKAWRERRKRTARGNGIKEGAR